MSGRIEGFFLAFTQKESEQLEQYLTRQGYEFSIDGLKSFLFNCVKYKRPRKADPLDAVVSRLEAKVMEDPVAAMQTLTSIADTAKAWVDKMKKPRR